MVVVQMQTFQEFLFLLNRSRIYIKVFCRQAFKDLKLLTLPYLNIHPEEVFILASTLMTRESVTTTVQGDTESISVCLLRWKFILPNSIKNCTVPKAFITGLNYSRLSNFQHRWVHGIWLGDAVDGWHLWDLRGIIQINGRGTIYIFEQDV